MCSWIWKNEYSQNDHTTQDNLQIECNSSKLPMAFFTKLENNILNLYGSLYTYSFTLYSQSNLEKEKQSWTNQAL